MIAIFDCNSKLVGWYDEKKSNVFGTDMTWIGFIENGNFFDSDTTWLGGFRKGTFVDRRGKPVAWIKDENPTGTLIMSVPLRPLKPMKPLTPMRPMTPLRPLKPLTPLGGWSDFTWSEYITQK